jgi:hypothetical protein
VRNSVTLAVALYQTTMPSSRTWVADDCPLYLPTQGLAYPGRCVEPFQREGEEAELAPRGNETDESGRAGLVA